MPTTQELLARALEIADDKPDTESHLARLAVDLSLDDAVAAERAAQESVALARESNDRTALLESLMRSASMSLAPHSTDRSPIRSAGGTRPQLARD